MRILLLFGIFLILSCEKKDTTVVLVNGVHITEEQIQEQIELQNNSFQNLSAEEKETLIQQKASEMVDSAVISYEAKRLGTSDQELFGFFDQLKNRKIEDNELAKYLNDELKGSKDIQNESKVEIINLMRQKQYDAAKSKYLAELKKRSTIRYIIKKTEK